MKAKLTVNLQIRGGTVESQREFVKKSMAIKKIKGVKIKLTKLVIFCNQCKEKFKTFGELEKHLKKTGHIDE